MKLSDMLVGLIFAAFGLWMFIASAGFPAAPGMAFGSGLFPRILAVGFMVCGALLAGQQMLSSDPDRWFTRPIWAQSLTGCLRFGLVPLGILFYILVAPHLGMIPTSVLILAVFFALLNVRMRVGLPVALLAPIGVYLLFSKFLLVPLPRGLLEGMPF